MSAGRINDVNDVRDAVREIRRRAGDDEAAHGLEDALHRATLKAIANGNPHPAELAKAALRTVRIGFARWCA